MQAKEYIVQERATPAENGLAFTKLPSKPVNSIIGECPHIFDIRRERKHDSLLDEIVAGLDDHKSKGKTLPTLLLYDEVGLKLFEDITYLEEYYLTNEEIEVLSTHADAIAAELPPGAILCELGSGNLRKINILLQAIEKQSKPVEYYALDVNHQELRRTLAKLPEYHHVQCFGLLGTYEDGLLWLKAPQTSARYRVVLSLGSSIGNFSRSDASLFVKDFASAVGEKGAVLLGIDGCTQPQRVFTAYNDSRGITRQFTLNGLAHANELIGRLEFAPGTWDAVGRYDEEHRRHQAFVVPREDAVVLGVSVHSGEMIRIEESYKYNDDDVLELWNKAEVKPLTKWANARGNYAMHLVAEAQHAQPSRPERYASRPVPTWHEWQSLWHLWDTVTRHMIPDEELLNKPIKLRNACIFYLGHIPTFFDMKLTDTTCDPPTEPTYYYSIFERGIDPDVEDPEKCHAHSEIPDEWPPLSEILIYQKRVRERVKSLYDRGADANPKIGRCLWLGYEHEAMHLETLLYMLVQSEKTLPPNGVTFPDWKILAEEAKKSAVPNEWIDVPAQDVILNMDDPENETTSVRYFGWDVEKPQRKAHVPKFSAKARPITNGEYAQYLIASNIKTIPASWSTSAATVGAPNGLKTANGNADESATNSIPARSVPDEFLREKFVRTVFGTVPLADALTWPICASYDELAGCALYMGGRIPTFEEARSIYAFAEYSRAPSNMAIGERLGRTIPAVNSHLVNEGVPESPPPNGHPKSHADSKMNPRELFVDLTGRNVGFDFWRPSSVVQNGGRLSGQGDMGGVWEWTSSPLKQQPGFEPMPLYPAYSADFYDGKHNIMLGGSWATVPRIAGRKSFINWYQRNYPYVWAGARLVKDA